jgi:hypothetical protein
MSINSSSVGDLQRGGAWRHTSKGSGYLGDKALPPPDDQVAGWLARSGHEHDDLARCPPRAGIAASRGTHGRAYAIGMGIGIYSQTLTKALLLLQNINIDKKMKAMRR